MSIIGAFTCWPFGLIGAICGLRSANRARAMVKAEPHVYKSDTATTGRVLNIVSLIFNSICALLAILLIVLLVAFGLFQSIAKERQLNSIPVGLIVTATPDPVDAEFGVRYSGQYSWTHYFTVASNRGPVQIYEYGVFRWLDGDYWLLESEDGIYDGHAFAMSFDCPDAIVQPDSIYTSPDVSADDYDLYLSKAKWYFLGIDENGNHVKGEIIVTYRDRLKSNAP